MINRTLDFIAVKLKILISKSFYLKKLFFKNHITLKLEFFPIIPNQQKAFPHAKENSKHYQAFVFKRYPISLKALQNPIMLKLPPKKKSFQLTL